MSQILPLNLWPRFFQPAALWKSLPGRMRRRSGRLWGVCQEECKTFFDGLWWTYSRPLKLRLNIQPHRFVQVLGCASLQIWGSRTFLHCSSQFKLKYPSSSFWNTFSFIYSNNWQSIKAHPHRFFSWWCQGFQRNKTESESVVHYCFLVQVIILTEG